MTSTAAANLAAIAAAAMANGAPVTKLPAAMPAKAKPAKATTKAKAAPAPAAAAVAVTANLPKCATAKAVVAKPQHKMLRRIASIGKHPGHALRIKRWHLYKVGMSLAHCKATPGLDHLDVLYYVQHGLMQLRDATPAELAQDLAPWTVTQPAPAVAPATPATPAPATT